LRTLGIPADPHLHRITRNCAVLHKKHSTP
jgi:hypothetical protein